MIKKIKSFFLLCFGMFFAFSAGAQNFSLGVRSGISIPNLTGGGGAAFPLSTDYKSRFGIDEAISGEYHFSKLFSLQVMAEYSSQGGKRDGNQALARKSDFLAGLQQSQGGSQPPIDPAILDQLMTALNSSPANYIYADANNVSKLNYLLIPVSAKFGWNLRKNSPVRFYFDGGPFVGFLLNAKQEIKNAQNISLADNGIPAIPLPIPGQFFDGTQDVKSSLHTFNIGFSGEVGFAYNFNEKNNIFIEGGGNYGFRAIQKDPQDGKNHVGAGTVGLGYAHTF
ncbi:MAG: outer membrane beta-barrel protein [Chitinophagaceae bacterium]|nr:outer membrane beta-barrel protein [Chitinophagaceae bacterium]